MSFPWPLPTGRILSLLGTINNKLTALTAQVENIMATLDQETAQETALAGLVTNTLIPEIQALQAQVTQLGGTPDTSKLDAAIQQLQTALNSAVTDAQPVPAQATQGQAQSAGTTVQTAQAAPAPQTPQPTPDSPAGV